MGYTGGMLVCGVDEVGRGCLAGVVVAAAVVFGHVPPAGLRDSKKLPARERERMDAVIRDDCMAFAIGFAGVDEIDRYNIRNASGFAMQRAVSDIVICPDKVVVDGDFAPDFPYPAECVVGGDDIIPEIMAASIIAKVYRDKLMRELDAAYPQYGFADNKGYPTPAHLEAIRQHGVCEHHRRSFAPVAAAAESAAEATESDAVAAAASA